MITTNDFSGMLKSVIFSNHTCYDMCVSGAAYTCTKLFSFRIKLLRLTCSKVQK